MTSGDYISKSALINLFKDLRDEHETNAISYVALCEVILQQKSIDETEIIRKYEKKTMRFPTIQEMAKEVVERAMNEYEYEGKTILQWVEVLKDYDDKKSTLERIVQKLEKEKSDWNYDYNVPLDNAIKIVKEECGISE